MNSMSRPPKSHLLEELRVEADALTAKRAQQEKLSRGVLDRIDQRLHAVFQYFDEACKLLQVIAPQIERVYSLPHVVRYEALTFEHGSVTFRKQTIHQRDVYDYVVIYYGLTGPSPPPLQVTIRRSAEVERALAVANIEFTSTMDSTVRGAAAYNVIRVAPGLRCEVRFDPDFVNERITVTLRNVDRFEPVVLDFDPAALDAG